MDIYKGEVYIVNEDSKRLWREGKLTISSAYSNGTFTSEETGDTLWCVDLLEDHYHLDSDLLSQIGETK